MGRIRSLLEEFRPKTWFERGEEVYAIRGSLSPAAFTFLEQVLGIWELREDNEEWLLFYCIYGLEHPNNLFANNYELNEAREEMFNSRHRL